MQQQNLMDLLPEKTNKKLHRRDFFKKSGIAVASATVLAGSLSAYSSYAQNKSKPKMRLAMVIDLRKCYGCQSCSIACKSEFNVPLGVRRSQVETTDKGQSFRRYCTRFNCYFLSSRTLAVRLVCLRRRITVRDL